MKLRSLKWMLALLSLICIVLNWKLTIGLDGTEFPGGRITGPLHSMSDAAFVLFIVSLLLLIRLPRVSAAASGIATLLCIPLSFLLLAPGPFRRIAGGKWTAPLDSNFVLSRWTVGWSLALLTSVAVALAILLQPRTCGRMGPRV